ncbi:ABC transporter permease [Aquimonas voraii]|uniref:Putative ABC transport system permease protein n=1 Tax=Aquimonas voraii TaxID=265719 RepID=A0A1G6T778_9GAMM|nr:ABC transporter permease [Aquimonas voraii]SDD24940.1 putative ABC transport system permease protein [Aquimonas voraii]
MSPNPPQAFVPPGRVRFRDILYMALFALRGNWLRSTLTALGVIIGIAAVIVMVSVGQGTQAQLDQTISRLGSNRIDVMPNWGRQGAVRMGAGSIFSLTMDDVEAIRERIPEARFVSATVRGSAQVIQAEQNWSTQWQGVQPDFFRILDWTLAAGDETELASFDGTDTVVVLGQTVREKLFGEDDPIGATIRIGRVPFTVVGVANPKGQSGWGGDQDDTVFVPLDTARRRLMGQMQLPPGTVQGIVVGTASSKDMAKVEADLNAVLKETHKIPPGGDDDFIVRNLTQLVSARNETTRLMSMLLGAVAGISLVVGGIGIMNIMLVSVTERIREIGLRMAVGAGPKEIQRQFLAEAMMISLGGGIIGIAIGIAGALLAGRIGALPVELSFEVIALATGFAVATGLFFGYYPARKAAQLDPIEALRHQG